MDYHKKLFDEIDYKAEEVIKTMPRFAKKFFNYITTEKRFSPRTKLQYAYDIKRFLVFLSESAGFRNIDINSLPASDVIGVLTKDDIREYLDTLIHYEKINKTGESETKVVSNATIARQCSSLRSFLTFYFVEGDITNNLSELLVIPKVKDNDIETLSYQDIQRLLAVIKDTSGLTEAEMKRHKKIIKRDYAILITLLGTGIRVSELVGIDIDDIDFEDASIMVTRKGGDKDRVFFNEIVENALLDYLEDRDILLDGNKEKAFFISMHHGRISVDSVEKLVKRYSLKANININVTPHSCRKTFGTHVYEETGDIYLVADALHHASVETTRKHYANISKEHKRIASQKAASLFRD